jgi:hypothetical protein
MMAAGKILPWQILQASNVCGEAAEPPEHTVPSPVPWASRTFET